MKKVVIEKAGSYDQLKLREFSIPQVKKNQILIETHACGVNFADCCVRMGVYSSATEFIGWPITPGFEVSGVVIEIGSEVKTISVGQRVAAITFFGGYSTHVVVDERAVFPIPSGISFIEAAAIPVIFLTAYYAVHELAHPHAKDQVLVHSAAGGVGGALCQLCKLANCQVVGVVGREEKIVAAKQMGAHFVINKSTQDLWKEAENISPKGFDIIFDANGVETLRQSYDHLKKSGGKLVVYGFHTMFTKGRGTPNWIKMFWDYMKTPRFNPLQMTKDNRSVLAFNLSYLYEKFDLLRSSMEKIITLFESNKLIMPDINTYPLENVQQAHRDLESGNTIGKLVLTTKS